MMDGAMAPLIAAEANIACDVKGVSPAAATMSAYADHAIVFEVVVMTALQYIRH